MVYEYTPPSIDVTYDSIYTACNCVFVVLRQCWENEVGSELYQLMIVDLFFMLVFELGLEYARKIAHQ